MNRHRVPESNSGKIIRWVLIAIALIFLALFLVTPLLAVFAQALDKGWAGYREAIRDPETVSAIRLTLIAAAFAVPLNTLFGIAAAWSITKFDFRGKNLLITILDLPFAVSPVISGLIFVLIFGA
ncbi:MAG TPA: sulfate/thiosulfate ABC transporter permease CysW, partial [Terriglobia bacterium]|nr:sulfate/thiosulfate ABC transporter permease CysW [Terriglobia bacterium]